MARKKIVELEMIKGIAILAVIGIHITAGGISSEDSLRTVPSLVLILNQLSRFAVPAFVFSSGAGLTFSDKNENYFSFLWRRTKKLIPLYALWTIVCYLIFNFQTMNMVDFIISFLTGGAFYHLYYVPLILTFYILYPIFKVVSKHSLLVSLMLFVTIITQLLDEIFGVEILNHAVIFLNWAFYFVIGIWFANNLDKVFPWVKKKKKFIILGSLLISFLLIVEVYFYNLYNFNLGDSTTSMRPSIIIYSFSVIFSLMSINWRELKIVKVIEYFSRKSYGIYLSHALILFIFERIIIRFGLPLSSPLYLIISFLIVLSASIIVSNILDFFVKKFNSIVFKQISK